MLTAEGISTCILEEVCTEGLGSNGVPTADHRPQQREPVRGAKMHLREARQRESPAKTSSPPRPGARDQPGCRVHTAPLLSICGQTPLPTAPHRSRPPPTTSIPRWASSSKFPIPTPSGLSAAPGQGGGIQWDPSCGTQPCHPLHRDQTHLWEMLEAAQAIPPRAPSLSLLSATPGTTGMNKNHHGK